MKYVLMIILFVASLSMFSQETLSILDCINIAIENSLEIAQAENQLESSQLDYRQSKMNRLPYFNSNLGNTWNFGRSLDITSYQFRTQNNRVNNLGLSGGATLFSGGQLNQNIKLQELNTERNSTNIKSMKDNLAINVAQLYLSALVAKEQIKVVENLVDLRKNDVDRNQKLIDAGVNPGSTQVDMDAQLANANFQLQQATNAYQSALLQLKQQMMVDFDREFEVEAPNIPFPSMDYIEEELSPDIVYQGALENLNVSTLNQKDIQIAQINKKIAKSRYFPELSVSGGLNSYASNQAQNVVSQEEYQQNLPLEGIPGLTGGYITVNGSYPVYDDDYTFSEQVKDNFTQNIGLNLSIPIFNQNQVNTQVKQADLNIKLAKINAKIQERQLEQTIQLAYLDAQLAYRAYESSRLQLESVSQAATFAKERLDIGAASIYDYFMAQNNLATSEVEFSKAKYDYLYKVKILEFYKENQFEF